MSGGANMRLMPAVHATIPVSPRNFQNAGIKDWGAEVEIYHDTKQ